MPYKNKEKEKAYQKRYRQKNKEKLKVRRRQYCQENKEQINAYAKQYWKENKERLNANKRRCWKEKNEQRNARQRQYYQENKEQIRIHDKRCYRGNREEALNLFGNCCYFCSKGKDKRRLEFHKKDGNSHPLPSAILALKSPNEWTLLCRPCHKGVHFCMEILEMTWDEIELYFKHKQDKTVACYEISEKEVGNEKAE